MRQKQTAGHAFETGLEWKNETSSLRVRFPGGLPTQLEDALQGNNGTVLVIDGKVVLIVAVSARALAQSTRRAGKEVVAIDAFGDEDAREACRELVVAPNAQNGFAHVDLEPIVSRLVRTHKPFGIVFGSGFEDCPAQLAKLTLHAPLFGASPAAVATTKDPLRFSKACADVGLLHPEINLTNPLQPKEWLIKRVGGSGGTHIQNAATHNAKSAADYWQRRISGGSLSLLFSFIDGLFTPLGWSEQWTSPSLTMPYRYGGAAGPVVCRNEQPPLKVSQD